MKTAIIDGDIPVYTECASAASRGQNPFGDYFPDVAELTDRVISVCEEWREMAGCQNIIIAYTHESRRNFRKDVLPGQYKAGRASEKPGGYYEVLENIISHYPSITIEGVEGDDVCGIIHTSPKTGDTVVISTDKDFRTLPGLLFNPMKMVEPIMITPNSAIRYWMYQTLMGDRTDGYLGAPKIGPVKAERILDERDGGVIPSEDEMSASFYEARLWQAVANTYVSCYPDMTVGEAHSEAIRQARCARILHRCDYDRIDGLIRLWHPDSAEWVRP